MESLREQLLVLLTMPVYVIVIIAELVLSHLRERQTYALKNTLYNFYLMSVNTAIDVLFRGIYVVILAWCYNHHFITVSNAVVYWFALLLLEDFAYYWLHRLDHQCRLFWAVHVTHHSSGKLNFSVGFRSSVFEPLYRFVFIPIAFLGFHALDIVFMYSATQIWGILVHTEKIGKLGFLEKIFVTPSHHRVHHANNPRYLDKNLGMFLIIWDKWFGTFEREDKNYQPLRYGLSKPIEEVTPVNIIFHEWESICSDLKKEIPVEKKIRYVLGPPGWSHDGSRFTSEQLRRKEEELTVVNQS